MAPKDTQTADPVPALAFLHSCRWEDLPSAVQHQTRRCLLDTLGVAAGGHGTALSAIIRDHAAEDMPGAAAMLFDSRRASRTGAAMAAGMMIDSLDGHDGYNPAKGHIGAPLVPGLLVFGQAAQASGRALLEALAVGYEIGGRTAVAQHDTCPDYHTSGSWGAVAVAAAGARLMGLGVDATRHALGIAEYHGPRSQMMRCIDHPTMLKDGAGWGALCGVSAVQLAARGFTGAPAITVENTSDIWADLGQTWVITQQYFKPYPVCRWAQAPVEGVLALRRAHQVDPAEVAKITVETFHESTRLAVARPQSTEEAQYSTSFPCAVAMARGAVRPEDIAGAALSDPEVLRLSDAVEMREHAFANDTFPAQRHARVALHLRSGEVLQGNWMNPLWTAEAPPTDAELSAKFHDLADPVLGQDRAAALEDTIWTLEASRSEALWPLLHADP